MYHKLIENYTKLLERCKNAEEPHDISDISDEIIEALEDLINIVENEFC